uniref:Uncharacterized protein n=1 Tax=Branchiostoma floridae TaxID=7739 RepID=C3YMQ9_BRAFL|eukprot:XP_002602388.1 hypothetical protein BRAFLDRAFT_63523 [Branchiostoma floridae]
MRGASAIPDTCCRAVKHGKSCAPCQNESDHVLESFRAISSAPRMNIAKRKAMSGVKRVSRLHGRARKSAVVASTRLEVCVNWWTDYYAVKLTGECGKTVVIQEVQQKCPPFFVYVNLKLKPTVERPTGQYTNTELQTQQLHPLWRSLMVQLSLQIVVDLGEFISKMGVFEVVV